MSDKNGFLLLAVRYLVSHTADLLQYMRRQQTVAARLRAFIRFSHSWGLAMRQRALPILACTILLVVACGPTASGGAQSQTPGQVTSTAISPWKPSAIVSWQIQYTALPVDLSVDAQVYDSDLFTTNVETIAALHGKGRNVVCYFSAGSYEPYRPDSGQFSADVRGKPIEGFADEQWLDIRRLEILGPILRARLDLAVQRGCDGVDPDNVDGYSNNTGFPLTAQDQLAFNRWLAQEAHLRGLAVFLKNDGDQVNQLVDRFDGAVVEQCFEYDECDQYVPFVAAGKPVFEIEYNRAPDTFCDQANALNFNSLYKHLSLDAYRVPCR